MIAKRMTLTIETFVWKNDLVSSSTRKQPTPILNSQPSLSARFCMDISWVAAEWQNGMVSDLPMIDYLRVERWGYLSQWQSHSNQSSNLKVLVEGCNLTYLIYGNVVNVSSSK